jgi:hypothetical protein
MPNLTTEELASELSGYEIGPPDTIEAAAKRHRELMHAPTVAGSARKLAD